MRQSGIDFTLPDDSGSNNKTAWQHLGWHQYPVLFYFRNW